MNITISNQTISNVGKINVLLGKNGSGKSTLLRRLEQEKHSLPDVGFARYITPERGGDLIYQGHLETNIAQDPNWADNVRRNNRFDNFRQLSVTEFRRLESLVLRKIEKDVATRQNLNFSFETTLELINSLLDNVSIVREDSSGFEIVSKNGKQKRAPSTLSSGESELVSLAIEILSFAYRAETYIGKRSYLFLDEPDAHLHPDLQERLISLLVKAIEGKDVVVIIATHSTAILGALSDNPDARISFVSSGQTEHSFVSISDALRSVLPIFGAHPLSNIFNRKPILLVEGEDDERIWQQAVRTSQGKLNVWPCPTGDIQSLAAYEDQIEEIAKAIYENAKAYSLRDRDDSPYEIDDKLVVKRMRLFCRAAENLIVTDDVLKSLGTDWDKMKAAIEDWLVKFPNHQQYAAMNAFKNTNYNRLETDLKPVRNVLMMLAGSQKAWEVVVGQAIAKLLTETALVGEHSLTAYLGPKLIAALNLTLRTKALFLKKRNRFSFVSSIT